MPEIRYYEEYEKGTGKLLRRIPYVVSDEELRLEQLIKRKDEIMKKPRKDWTIDDIKDLIEYIITQLKV